MSDQPDSMDTRARDARVSRFGKMMRRMALFSLLVGAVAAAAVVHGDFGRGQRDDGGLPDEPCIHEQFERT